MLRDISLNLFWLALAVILGVIEAATLGLVTIWFAIGALFALFVSMLGLPFLYQVITFIVSSSILLYFTKPIIKNYLKLKTERTNADRVLGETGIVTEAIDTANGKGQVKVKGQIWSARSIDNSDIGVDEKVEIQSISGVKLIVKRLSE